MEEEFCLYPDLPERYDALQGRYKEIVLFFKSKISIGDSQWFYKDIEELQ